MQTGLVKNFNLDKRYEDESVFQKDAEDYIELRGGHVDKYNVTAYSKKGTPDLIGCFLGRYVCFELKVKDNKPTKIQEMKMRSVRLAGGIAKPAWTLREIKETLDEISRVQQGS